MTWTDLSGGLTDVSALALVANPGTGGAGETILFGANRGGGVFRSTNNGTSWYSANTPFSGFSQMLQVGPDLFAATGSSGAYLSTNNGTSWTAVDNGLPRDRDDRVDCIVSSPGGANRTNLFAGTSKGVFLSTNNGGSWTAVSNGLTSHISALAVSGMNIFATAYGGVFLSTNNGTSWETVSHGLPNINVSCLAVSGPNLFAGTGAHFLVYNGSGIWRRPLSEMIPLAGVISSAMPFRFALEQNYPNPFNPSTTIKFGLPKSSEVRVSVYDMLGREVSVLVNERKDAGVHEVKCDGSNLASGVYFYRLQAGDFTQTKRLMLLR
jgi:hypothetical protein